MPEDLKIPEQHAFETGNVVTPKVPASEMAVAVSFTQGGRTVVASGASHFSDVHNAAAILHGWGKRDANGNDETWGHRHHSKDNQPIRLTQADYLKALEAASATDEHGEYVPHPGALSEYVEARAHHEAHAKRVEEMRVAKAEAEKAEAEKANKLKSAQSGAARGSVARTTTAPTPADTEAAKV